MEIALLLGMTGDRAPEPMRRLLPALRPEALEMLGQRDDDYRREIGVSSIAERVRLHTAQQVGRDPEQTGARAAAHVAARASGWWLHLDLDVLDRNEFRACGASSDPSMPAGLTWAQLTAITQAALRDDDCRGWSIGVYNSDLDPSGRDAKRIVSYLASVTASSGGPTSGATDPGDSHGTLAFPRGHNAEDFDGVSHEERGFALACRCAQ